MKRQHWLCVTILAGLLLLTASKGQAEKGQAALFLPFITTLEALPPLPEALVRIEPGEGINGSTFTPGSFVIVNPTSHEQQITEVIIDLRTAVFPDMVFDPNGLAGDVVAKDVQVDGGGTLVGYDGRSYASPHDDGYDVLVLQFTDFDPGEQFAFSVDVDPTSIRGTAVPGPNQSGSVSGLELAGTTITVTFDDGLTVTGQTFRLPGSVSGSEALVRAGLPGSPLVTVAGIGGNTAVVTDPNQTLQVTGDPHRTIQVLLIEGGLFIENGGFDIDPFEANSAIGVQGEITAVTNSSGQAHIPFTLSHHFGNDGGFNYILLVQENDYGMFGATSSPIIIKLED
jgi:hypothetical protein